MTFCIVTHVQHTKKGGSYFAYSPYVNEMNIWLKYADRVIIAAPLHDLEVGPIHTAYTHAQLEFIPLKSFNTLSLLAVLRSLLFVPVNFWRISIAMKKSDHIHLRCPGNIGLLGCFAQIFFPKIKKTAKYAGNWDPAARQPLSYRLQKWLLSNTVLTRNIQVLVYGKWPNQTVNLRPFFTATYAESEKETVLPRKFDGQLKFVFVGGLTAGKQPLYAVSMVEKLRQIGYDVVLSVYGEGPEKEKLQEYVAAHAMADYVLLQGNHDKQHIKKAYRQSHFLILPSKSEGWPKVVAEAMFWGCLPVATQVSCIGFMLGQGNRGVLLDASLSADVSKIVSLIANPHDYELKVNAAIDWSRRYTTDVFEQEIGKMMQP